MGERFTHKLIHPDKISDLLEQYKSEVNQVLKSAKQYVQEHPEVAKAAEQAPLDELYTLRFILSSRSDKVGDATQNLIKTLHWRAENLADLIKAGETFMPFDDELNKYSHYAVVGYLGGLHPVAIVRAGRTRTKTFFEVGETVETMIRMQLLIYEYIFRMCGKSRKSITLSSIRRN